MSVSILFLKCTDHKSFLVYKKHCGRWWNKGGLLWKFMLNSYKQHTELGEEGVRNPEMKETRASFRRGMLWWRRGRKVFAGERTRDWRWRRRVHVEEGHKKVTSEEKEAGKPLTQRAHLHARLCAKNSSFSPEAPSGGYRPFLMRKGTAPASAAHMWKSGEEREAGDCRAYMWRYQKLALLVLLLIHILRPIVLPLQKSDNSQFFQESP